MVGALRVWKCSKEGIFMSVRSRSLPTRTRVLMHCDCCSCQTEKELRDASLSDTGHVNAKALVSVLLSKACSTVMTRVRTAEGLACRAYRIFNPRSVRSSCFVFSLLFGDATGPHVRAVLLFWLWSNRLPSGMSACGCMQPCLGSLIGSLLLLCPHACRRDPTLQTLRQV